MEAYIRADTTARAERNRTGIQNGYITPNEARAEENRNKMEGADRLFIQSNMMPLDKADTILLNKTKPAPLARSLRENVTELAELAEAESNSNGNGKH